MWPFESPSSDRAHSRRGHVLVIDDEPFVADALAMFIVDEHDVTVLNDAREAIARLSAGESYDVILCDIMMPEMTGIAFHQELTATLPEHAPRVVFITGGAFTAATRAYLDGVPNECFEKPPDLAALLALLRTRVAESRAATSNAERTASSVDFDPEHRSRRAALRSPPSSRSGTRD